MQLGQIELPVYPAEAITGGYLFQGDFKPIGPILAYLNDSSRRFAQFESTTCLPLAVNNPLKSIQRPIVMLRKADLVAISLLDEAGRTAAQLLQTRHTMIVYTNDFVIQGECHMGADDLPLDLLSSGRNDFVGFSDATVFPITPLRHAPARKADLLMLNRHAIQFYHLAD